jgi:AcrR family transcriptional regulator
MARRATISTAEILTSAREVFLERGADAPTAEIARRAGVSEGSIFRRFPTKQALFLAAMGIDKTPPWLEELDHLGGDNLRDELAELALRIIEGTRELLPRMMMTWSTQTPPRMPTEAHAVPARIIGAVTAFFDRQMRAGHLRVAHPEIVARTFVGTLIHYVFVETMGIETAGMIDARTFARSLVDTLWQGIRPQPVEGDRRDTEHNT